MKIAFHFDIDLINTTSYRYDFPILDKIFSALLKSNFNNIHLKFFLGDLSSAFPGYLIPPQNIDSQIKLVAALLDDRLGSWRDGLTKFLNAITTKKSMYIVCIEGLGKLERDFLTDILKDDSSYLGAIQINGANQVHRFYSSDYLIPKYRYINKELRILYPADQGDKDLELEKHWNFFSFKSVQWENLGLRHTIFDRYESLDHAQRLAELNETISNHLIQLADDVLLRIGELDPNLQNILYSAFRNFSTIQTPEDIAQVALSCRRFLTSLANVLYPPRNELINNRKLDAAAYRNRLWKYVEEELKEANEEKKLVLIGLQDLGGRIDKIDNLANKGLHHSISLLDLHRLLIALVTTTYDLLSLSSLPTSLPLEPYTEEFMNFFNKSFPLKDSDIPKSDT